MPCSRAPLCLTGRHRWASALGALIAFPALGEGLDGSSFHPRWSSLEEGQNGVGIASEEAGHAGTVAESGLNDLHAVGT